MYTKKADMIHKITHICENVYDLQWTSGTVIGIYDSCFNILTDTGELLTFFKNNAKYSTRAFITDIDFPVSPHYLSENSEAKCDGKTITVDKLIFDTDGAEKILTKRSPIKSSAKYDKSISVFEEILKKHGKNSPVFENGILKEKSAKGIDTLKHDLTSGFEALVGMGIGLTPTCDDMLAGMSAWFHLTDTGHKFNKALSDFLSKKGDVVTTTVSKNLLSDSANGYINGIVYDVIDSILSNKSDIEKYTLQLIGYGSTSGTETCAGILEGYKFTQMKEQIKWL